MPPLAGAVPGYEVVYWMGLFAPAATPREIRTRLAGELRKAMHDEEMKRYPAVSGAEAVSRDVTETEALLERDIEVWGKAVREAGARVD